MLFGTNPNENIVIVPPKPDALLSHHDEFSYSNLYCYDNNGDSSGRNDTNNNSGASTVTTEATTSATTGINTESATTTAVTAFAERINNGNKQPNGNSQHSLTTTASSSSSTSTDATTTTPITRDPRNGAFTFQVHAEYDLLLHVQKDLDKHRSRNNSNSSDSDIHLSKLITRSIDEYCLRKQWMYHIGSEKGVAIGRFLRESAEKWYAKMKKEWQQQQGNDNSGEVKKFICVELGTYCGYSALVLASTLRQFVQDQQQQQLLEQETTSSDAATPPPFEFHIYTTEVSTKLMNVAQSIFRLAKMEQYITPILMKQNNSNNSSNNDDCDSLSQTLQKQQDGAVVPSNNIDQIDFLLLDHAKHLYLKDVQDLENAKLIRAGSHVSADNVVFNRLDAYRDHMHALGLEGVVESRLEEMNLEYSNNLKDGMEMTVYLKDPSCVTKK